MVYSSVKIFKKSKNAFILEKQSHHDLTKLYFKGVMGIEKSSMHQSV